MKNKTLLIIGAAQEHCIGIQTAQELGLHVVVVDGNPDSPGFKLADAFIIASTYDHIAIYEEVKKYIAKGKNIDGVMTLASDVPYSVAFIADKLGLNSISLSAAKNASDKIIMKDCFAEMSVPMPRYSEVSSSQELMKIAEEWALPVVIKPVDSRGARGVQIIKDINDLDNAYNRCVKYSPQGRVMVEEYLKGPQLSTEGFMIDGEAYIPAIFDRNYEYLDRFAPYIVENGGEMPSVYTKKYKDEIIEVMKSAGVALGITTGVIKGDLVINNGKVKVIEIAARLSGGFFGTVATPVSCGVDLVKINIQFALGEKLDPESLSPKFQRAAAIRFSFPSPGIIKNISGFEDVQTDDHCRYSHLFVKVGDKVEPITNHPARPAVVVADGNNVTEAIDNSNRIINKIIWEVEND